MGYHIPPLLDKIEKQKIQTNIFCIEPNPEILAIREFQTEFSKLQDIAQTKGISLEIGALPEKDFSIFFHPFYSRNFPELCENFEKSLQKGTNAKTKNYFEKIWLMNYFKNLSMTEKKNFFSIESLKHICQNKTLVFTGASPELEDDIEWLARNRGHIIIIASDTSHYFLLQNNILPDYIISIDAGRGTSYHFRDNLPKEIPVLTWLGANNRIFSLSNPVYVFFTNYPLDQFYAEIKKQPVLDNPTLNISGMAKVLCQYMGAEQILFSGVSFVKSKGKSHCRGTGYENFRLTNISRKVSLESYATGYYSNSVETRDRQNLEFLLRDGSSKLDNDVKLTNLSAADTPVKPIKLSLRFDDFSPFQSIQLQKDFLRQSGFTPKSFRRFLKRLNLNV